MNSVVPEATGRPVTAVQVITVLFKADPSAAPC